MRIGTVAFEKSFTAGLLRCDVFAAVWFFTCRFQQVTEVFGTGETVQLWLLRKSFCRFDFNWNFTQYFTCSTGSETWTPTLPCPDLGMGDPCAGGVH